MAPIAELVTLSMPKAPHMDVLPRAVPAAHSDADRCAREGRSVCSHRHYPTYLLAATANWMSAKKPRLVARK